MKENTLHSLGFPLLLNNVINSMANFICFALIYNSSKEDYIIFNTVIATLSIFFATASMMFTGASINLSKEYGSNGNIITEKIKKLFSINIVFSIAVGIAVMVISLIFSSNIYVQANENEMFLSPHNILSISILAICIYSIVGIFMQSLGLASKYTKIMVAYSIIKIAVVLIILNYYPNEIVNNVLMSYVIMDYLLVVFLIFFLMKNKILYYKNDLFTYENSKEVLKGFKFSIPICIGMSVQKYIFAAILIIAASANIETASNFNAFINIFMLAVIPITSYGHALALLSGQSIGKGDYSKSYNFLLTLSKYSIFYLSFIVMLFYIIGTYELSIDMFSIYTNKLPLLILVFFSYFGIQIIIPYYRSFGEVFKPQIINTIVPFITLMFFNLLYASEGGEDIDENILLFLYLSIGFFPLLILGAFGWHKRKMFFISRRS